MEAWAFWLLLSALSAVVTLYFLKHDRILVESRLKVTSRFGFNHILAIENHEFWIAPCGMVMTPISGTIYEKRRA